MSECTLKKNSHLELPPYGCPSARALSTQRLISLADLFKLRCARVATFALEISRALDKPPNSSPAAIAFFALITSVPEEYLDELSSSFASTFSTSAMSANSFQKVFPNTVAEVTIWFAARTTSSGLRNLRGPLNNVVSTLFWAHANPKVERDAISVSATRG